MPDHPLLTRQLKKIGLSAESLPGSVAAWGEFLGQVDQVYRESESHLQRVENTLDVAFGEMEELHQQLDAQKHALDEATLVTITDANGKIRYANRQYLARTGFTEQEVIGKGHDITSSGYHSREYVRSLWETLRRGETWRGEFKNKAKDGSIFWVMTVIVPYLDSEKKPARFIGIQIDITDRKNAEELLATQKIKANTAEKMASLGEMAGGIAHEINTPLAAISLYAELLKEELQNDPINRPLCADQVAKIETTLEVVNKIIRGLRNFCRDGSNDPFTHEEPSRILQDTLVMTQDVFRRQNIPLKINNRLSDQCRVICRGVQISQVLVNLIRNALDAIASLPEKWVELELSETKDQVILKLTDSGPGIPKEVLEKIFIPFYTTKPVGKGTGLGLSISRQIMEEHHGSLAVDNRSSHTCFVLSLPKASSEPYSLEPDALILPSKAVLIVEDNTEFRELLIEIISSMGYTPFGSADGIEALQIFSEQRIDLILSDFSMPRMNGAALLTEIRKISSTPVVIISGDPGAATTPELQPANGFLFKPLDAAQVRAAIQKFLT